MTSPAPAASTNPGAEPAEAAAAPAAAPAAARKRPTLLIALAVLLVVAAGVVGFYVLRAGLESTDDAQVEAEVIAVPARTGGAVLHVLFAENQPVKEGDLLVEIDPAPAAARLAQAEAQLASAQAAAEAADADVQVVETTVRGQKSVAEASLAGAAIGATTSADEVLQAEAQVTSATVARQQATLDLDRARQLFANNAIPRQQLDAAQTALDAADANLAQARARQAVVRSSTAQAQARIREAQARLGAAGAVDARINEGRARAAVARANVLTAKAARDLAALDLSYTKILCPHDGVASKKSVSVGQMLAAGQPVAQIVPIREVWVTANFKETQLARMRPGQTAKIEIDAYPGLELHGEIESMSGATGARFSLLPPENATGNFTKVVQRVPVRLKLTDAPADKLLRPGMSADVTVDARK